MTPAQLSAAFFLQAFFILGACRVVGMLARRVGQPQVVGEMVAGVIMGPSLFGLLFPEVQQMIFPKESLKTLFVFAQLGVGLYMFLVGAEFKTELFRSRARSAASVSIGGMVAPFILGCVLALWLRNVPGLFSEKASGFVAALFLGAAMSITAFPMLARIIYEQGLTGTSLGTLALAAGAINDAAAWLCFGHRPCELRRWRDDRDSSDWRRNALRSIDIDDRSEAPFASRRYSRTGE
jgi:Kef-type K+ transport system membrane component KefB